MKLKNSPRFMASLLMLLLAAGCSGPELTETAKKEAESWCAQFGGAKAVSYGYLGGLRARCMDDKLIVDDSSS